MPEGAEGPRPSQLEQIKEEAHLEQSGSQENPEDAEKQERQRLTENMRELMSNLEQFSEYKPDYPVSGETKEKLDKMRERTKNAHDWSKMVGLITVGTSVVGEAYNLFRGGDAPPGAITAAVAGLGVAIAGGTEYVAAMANEFTRLRQRDRLEKGLRNLKGLMARGEETSTAGTQPSQTETGGDKT